MTFARSIILLVVAIVLEAIVFLGAVGLVGVSHVEAFQAAAFLFFMGSFL